MLFQAQTHVILNLRKSHSFSGLEINDQCLTHRNVCILVQFLEFCTNFKLTFIYWYKLLKPALISSRESFFLTINLGNHCKTRDFILLEKRIAKAKNRNTRCHYSQTSKLVWLSWIPYIFHENLRNAILLFRFTCSQLL